MNDDELLAPCPTCGRHTYLHHARCPFCKGSRPTPPTALAAALMAALSACPTRQSAEVYGAPPRPTVTQPQPGDAADAAPSTPTNRR